MQEILSSKIAVHFDIDEILKVLELLFADDIGVNAAKGIFLFYTVDFESRDIVMYWGSPMYNFVMIFTYLPKKTFCDIVQNSPLNTKLLRGQNKQDHRR